MVDWTAAGDVDAGSEEVLHYVCDALGSVVGLLDAGDPDATPEPVPAKLVERYDYDPYGKTYIAHWDAAAGSGSGDWVRHEPDEPSAYGNPFMWTGQRHDVAIGLYHFPFRTYSPRLGRWLQRDPLGYVDGVSLVQYCMSAPLRYIDPLGLEWSWYEGWGLTLQIFLQVPSNDDNVRAAQDEVALDVNQRVDRAQETLDTIGLVPGAGALADATNAALDLAQGDVAAAASNLVGVIPGGDAAKGVKKAGGAVAGVVAAGARNADDAAAAAGKAAKAGKQAEGVAEAAARKGGGKHAQHGKAEHKPSDIKRLEELDEAIKNAKGSEKKKLETKRIRLKQRMARDKKGEQHSQKAKGQVCK
jgi:RHS repeat-associated protein